MKHLQLELAKHPLLVKAFTGGDGGYTTAKVQLDSVEDDTYPAPDLEELLDLADRILDEPLVSLSRRRLYAVVRRIWINDEICRLTRLTEAIIALLEERQ